MSAINARAAGSASVPRGADAPLRIALLTYKGNPYCGGEGVYVRYLSRELARLGHSIEVISGQPYPVLDEVKGIGFTPLPSLDPYRRPDRFFHAPRLREIRDWIDAIEVAGICTGGNPAPLAFTLRARRHLAARAAASDTFDLVHDNGSVGYGLLGIDRRFAPLVTTIHHPTTVDLRLALAVADGPLQRLALRRSCGYHPMQRRVARRLSSVLTDSVASRRAIIDDMNVPTDRIHVVALGTDTRLFSPDGSVPEVPGRIVTTASADAPLKGLIFLIEALAKVRHEREQAHLVVVGPQPVRGPVVDAIERHGLGRAVTFVKGISDAELVDLIRGAEVACVPSLYEGFSLPTAEAMATCTPVVATTGGAIPEVAGQDGETCLAVPPRDPGALAAALIRLLEDPALRRRLGEAGRDRVLRRFTWEHVARNTVEHYRDVIAARDAERLSAR
ncbi:glycosyltransferase family 4 protein [Streptomyces bottropensis]|uniref:Glycosyltransferase family 4 protein n=1 Tax=Streptomyces bottropensis TaxID=42235 RepID=A0ABU8AUR5_9ACTN